MVETLQAKVGSSTGRIAFLFKSGREDRKSGSFPTEFFYGFVQLQEAGYDVEIITDRELDLDTPPSRFWRVLSQLVYLTVGITWWPLRRLARRTVRDRLNSYDCLVVTTNTFGICLGVLRRLGLIRANVLFIAMGLIEPNTPERVIAIYRWLFRKNVVLRTLSEINASLLASQFKIPVRHIPFGVDTSFWVPIEAGVGTPTENYILSIGNDSHRDYQTLLDAWKPNYPMLRIVTGQDIATTSPNVEIFRGDWHKQILTDEHIRTLMQRARFIILPIKNTIQPSGQSVCLQAMACGKAVIITDFPGLWNRELLRNGETCIIAGLPGIRPGIQDAVEQLLADRLLTTAIGTNARKIVESDLNVKKMAEAMAVDLDKLLAHKPAYC